MATTCQKKHKQSDGNIQKDQLGKKKGKKEGLLYLTESSRLVVSRTTTGAGVIKSPTTFPLVLLSNICTSLKVCNHHLLNCISKLHSWIIGSCATSHQLKAHEFATYFSGMKFHQEDPIYEG